MQSDCFKLSYSDDDTDSTPVAQVQTQPERLGLFPACDLSSTAGSTGHQDARRMHNN